MPRRTSRSRRGGSRPGETAIGILRYARERLARAGSVDELADDDLR